MLKKKVILNMEKGKKKERERLWEKERKEDGREGMLNKCVETRERSRKRETKMPKRMRSKYGP